MKLLGKIIDFFWPSFGEALIKKLEQDGKYSIVDKEEWETYKRQRSNNYLAWQEADKEVARLKDIIKQKNKDIERLTNERTKLQ